MPENALDEVDRRVLNALQEGFPLTERPFAVAGQPLGLSEAELIERVRRLREEGWLTRFGPMFDADRLGGGTTLAAMAVPAEDYDRVAKQVNAHPEVAHNYARGHALNMWFVIASERLEQIGPVIAAIEAETGLSVYTMPKEHEFFVKARFEA
ncbi:MAG: Lrp/AsnC family transcriptional regulator [Rhodospirillales bacterium]|jgi:DNA-binding Lrp family transcriptional regulator|nr:Lrp/AsnC family transcriptional regulator [Rhodospirillales bacterium]